jgi:hypothetical protein
MLGWLVLSWMFGQAAGWRDTYLLFLQLVQATPAGSAETRLEFGPLIAIGAAALGLKAWLSRSAPALPSLREQLGEHAGWVTFALLAAAHPRLFPYHLTPIALLVALVAARQLHQLWSAILLPLAAALPLLSAVSFGLGQAGSIRAVERVVSVPLDVPITSLRALKAAARRDDRVFDPSGVIYFLPPCGREWYVDVLFAGWVEQGRWMYSPLSPPCTWSLRTHRLAMVPKQHLAQLGPFRLQPGTGGLLSAESAEQRIAPLGLRDKTSSSW